METGEMRCGKCDGPMEEGWIPEMVPHSIGMTVATRVTRERWLRGSPTVNRDGYAHPSQAEWKFGIPVTTYRCTRCGFLEQYARERGDLLPLPAREAEEEADTLPRAA